MQGPGEYYPRNETNPCTAMTSPTIVTERTSPSKPYCPRKSCHKRIPSCIMYLYLIIALIFTRLSTCFHSPSTHAISFRRRDSWLSPTLSISIESLRHSQGKPLFATNNHGDTLGSWEEMHGNYVLRPPKSIQNPRALIHFLGGAIVGAAPDISYRYMLETLADNGFLIVATPYQLSFDYISTCDDIIAKFEKIAPDLARTFGALPVIGVGHSCGALLQLLITSLFPDTPRAANALISFNNKPAKEAVPFFEELVAPFFVAVSSDNATLPNAVQVIQSSLQILRAVGKGMYTW